MSVVESAVAGGRKEVALAAIAVLTAVLGAHGAGPAVSAPMWRRGLRAAGVGVEAAATPSCDVPLMARLALVDALGQLLVRAHGMPVSMLVPQHARPCSRRGLRPPGGRVLQLRLSWPGLPPCCAPVPATSSGAGWRTPVRHPCRSHRAPLDTKRDGRHVMAGRGAVQSVCLPLEQARGVRPRPPGAAGGAEAGDG